MRPDTNGERPNGKQRGGRLSGRMMTTPAAIVSIRMYRVIGVLSAVLTAVVCCCTFSVTCLVTFVVTVPPLTGGWVMTVYLGEYGVGVTVG